MLDTLVLSEQKCFQWTSERLVTTRWISEVSRQRILSRRSSDSKGPTTKWAELVTRHRKLVTPAERSRCILAMSVADVTQSVRYCGALCCWHRRTVTPSLYCTRSGTSSQCKSTCSRRDRPRSNLRVPLTRRAAAFSTRWSLSVLYHSELVMIANSCRMSYHITPCDHGLMALMQNTKEINLHENATYTYSQLLAFCSTVNTNIMKRVVTMISNSLIISAYKLIACYFAIRPIFQSASQPASQPTNHPTNQSINQSVINFWKLTTNCLNHCQLFTLIT